MKIIRVFPRRTKATPTDTLAYVGPPDLFIPPDTDEVHISVTFTADKLITEELAYQWQRLARVKVGGPAFGMRGEEFVAGRYLREGYTITSRGCPQTCWFCDVWKRDGRVRELPVVPGWNVLDDNLLACSRPHIEAVFKMLDAQRRRAEFTGGLDATLLEDYHVGLLADLRPRPVCFFAYDPGDDLGPIQNAVLRLLAAGFSTAGHRLRCYCLIGYPNDTFSTAEKRLRDILALGLTPHAMLWRPNLPVAARWQPAKDWRRFQRLWARPAIIHARGPE